MSPHDFIPWIVGGMVLAIFALLIVGSLMSSGCRFDEARRLWEEEKEASIPTHFRFTVEQLKRMSPLELRIIRHDVWNEVVEAPSEEQQAFLNAISRELDAKDFEDRAPSNTSMTCLSGR